MSAGQVALLTVLDEAQADYYGRARQETNPSAAEHWCAKARQVHAARADLLELIAAAKGAEALAFALNTQQADHIKRLQNAIAKVQP